MRRNGVNLLTGQQTRPWTAYAALEVFNEDWAENHFPGDGDGNLYRGVGGRLEYTGRRLVLRAYAKRTNEDENDWTRSGESDADAGSQRNAESRQRSSSKSSR